MADCVPITAGTGTDIAADLVGGYYHQRVKLSVGADGEAADLDGGQQTMTNSIPVALASDQALPVGVFALPSTVVHGQKTVTTAGTQVALGSTTTLYRGVRIKALHGNTGWIYVGASSVSSADGFVLDAGEEVYVETGNLDDVYIDSSVNGEGVSYIGS